MKPTDAPPTVHRLTARQTYKKARYRLKRSEVDALATKHRD